MMLTLRQSLRGLLIALTFALAAAPALAASSFTSCYTLENPATGDQTNTWGVTENTGRSIVDQALAGVLTQSLGSGGTTALADSQGAVSAAKNAEFLLTGTLTSNATVLWPNGRCRVFSVTNSTTGAFSTTLCVNNGASACAGGSVVIPQGQTMALYADGTNILPWANASAAGWTVNGSLNEASGTLASAATVAIGGAPENYVIVSGTTTITAFDTVAAGIRKIVKFSGALTLTNNASIILPGGANITTAAGDVATFVSEGGGVWRCVAYTTAAGTPVIQGPPTGAAGGDVGGTYPNPTVAKVSAATGAINEANTTVASGATTNIGAAAANYLFISGTTTITAFDTIQSGTERTLEFQGALTLTNNPNIVLPGGANITTAAGDTAIFRSEGSGVWRCIVYKPANGQTIFGTAAKADMQAATDANKIVTPAQTQNHPGVAKAWIVFNGTNCSIAASYNIASCTRNSLGNYTIAFTTAFSSANYAMSGSCNSSICIVFGVPTNSSSFALSTGNVAAGQTDASYTSAAFFGSQ